MESARVIFDPPALGSWNMAVDHALLETADQTGRISLRFYAWSQPTLSLGYFQQHSDRQTHNASLACPLVRRTTGGGAILHDREITYSLCIPSSNRWSDENEQLYTQMHQLLIDLLNETGVQTSLFKSKKNRTTVSSPPFLCFQRRSNGDLILGEHKIGGSAQRRKKHALLQHGSLLISQSECAPELLGISDLVQNWNLSPDPFLQTWAERLAGRLQLELVEDILTDQELESAHLAQTDIYENEIWTNRR